MHQLLICTEKNKRVYSTLSVTWKRVFYRFFRGEAINRKRINDIKIGEIITFNQFLSCTR